MRIAILTALVASAIAIPAASAADWFDGRCIETYAWKTKKDGAMQFRIRNCGVGTSAAYAMFNGGGSGPAAAGSGAAPGAPGK